MHGSALCRCCPLATNDSSQTPWAPPPRHGRAHRVGLSVDAQERRRDTRRACLQAALITTLELLTGAIGSTAAGGEQAPGARPVSARAVNHAAHV